MRGVKVPDVVPTMSAASGMATLGALPVFLLSAQSVFIRRDLDFDEGRFGLAVSSFYAAAATTAFLGGGIADRLGLRCAIYRRAVETVGSMVHVATSARDVRGALEAGIPVVRLRRPGHALDPDGPRPTYEVRTVDDLPGALADLG